ncbi:MAG: hypothetical protein LBL77_02495 [Endomicrobium sp.]|nr:hypothetical protein [Endomicrobium sp.]
MKNELKTNREITIKLVIESIIMVNLVWLLINISTQEPEQYEYKRDFVNSNNIFANLSDDLSDIDTSLTEIVKNPHMFFIFNLKNQLQDFG